VVILEGRSFQPAVLSVPVGATVTFVNRDPVGHTVTEGANGQPAANARVDTPLAPGATTTVTFATAGTVEITCRIHPRMHLTVAVGVAPPASGAPAPSPSLGGRYGY
jgi:plastocyanin